MRARIQKNIAAALLALGKHHQGGETLGLVLEGTGDAGAAFNLLLCANALGDVARVKGLFDSLLKVRGWGWVGMVFVVCRWGGGGGVYPRAWCVVVYIQGHSV